MRSTPQHTELFADHFRDHVDSYAIIGGTATLLHVERRTGKSPRTTRDLDVVVLDLSDESGTSPFLGKFNEYIKTNGYTCTSLSSGKSQAYRFTKPSSGFAPTIIEIISRQFKWTPDGQGAQRVEEHEMSAIALSPAFYELTKSQRTTEQIGELGNTPVPLAKVSALILLKSYAYQNLIGSDQAADRSKAPKHLQDIARLAAVLTDADALIAEPATYTPLAAVLDQADQHFQTSRLIECGWTKNSKPGDLVRAIQSKIILKAN